MLNFAKKSIHKIVMRALIFISFFLLLSCNKDTINYFELSTKQIEIGYKEQTIDISISSNTNWEVINIPDWISLDSKSGTGNYALKIKILQNSDKAQNGIFNSRSADILFIADHKTYLLKITQGSLGDIYLTTTSPKDYNLDYTKHTITLEISSNDVWRLLSTPNWVDVNVKSGNGDKVTVDLTISENLTNESREGYLLFGIVQPHWLSIRIKQDKKQLPKLWESVTDNYSGLSFVSRFMDFTFDNEGNPFVGYTSSMIGGDAFFHKYDGKKWLYVGDFEAYHVKIAFDSNNKPIVVHQETTLSSGSSGLLGYASLKRFDGSSWQHLKKLFSSGRTSFVNLVVDHNNNVFVVYSDVKNSGKIIVQKYDGKDMSIVGEKGFSVGRAKFCNIALDTKQNLIVSYVDEGLGDKVVVKKFNGANWEAIGKEGFSEGIAKQLHMKINSNDNILVIYKDSQHDLKISAKIFTNGKWEIIGDHTTFSEEVEGISFDVYKETPYIAYISKKDKLIYAKKYYNGKWEDLAEIRHDITEYYSQGNSEIKIKISPTGIPYIAFVTKQNGAVYLIKYLKK